MTTRKVKSIVAVLGMIAFMSITTFAQKTANVAIVDINKVLESVEDYKQAQDQLDKQAADWRQDIAQEYDKIKGLYNKYQAEQVLLSDEARKAKEEEIMDREKIVRELQRRRFGPEGELFKKRQELVQPIQDKVYGIIEDYAAERGYDLIFDKGGSAGLIFSNSEFEITDDIIKRL